MSWQEVHHHKSPMDRGGLARLKDINMGMTAGKHIRHQFNDYIQNNGRELKDNKRHMWEDVEFLVSQFNEYIGSTWRAVRQIQSFNWFSSRPMSSKTSGGAWMDDVFTKMPDWLEYLKSTNIIFEEPEVSGIRDDHEIHLDLTGDDEAAAAEGTAAEDAPRAPAHWIKTHPVRNGETLGEQLKQVEELSSRARPHLQRQAVLASAAAEQQALADERELEEASQEANRNARRAEKVYEVEEIVGKRGRDEDVEYRVHWLGYEARHRTWEKMESLGDARAAIARFEKKFKTKR